ncbi:unnamed protein product [Bacillus thuringiensis DB27]|uniref:Uncharacterized protein n=1 Tax=Bacillus thuringiensis DB27 TaxID=1431339 RepID=W8YBD7_BACTU|nr:unnamed protein product [Bacillus thuringiensis DB27]
MKGVMERVDQKLRSRIRVIIWKQVESTEETNQIACSTRDSGERSEGINLLSKGLPIYRVIESCSKSHLKSKTKEEGSPFFFRTLSKSSHCNIN